MSTVDTYQEEEGNQRLELAEKRTSVSMASGVTRRVRSQWTLMKRVREIGIMMRNGDEESGILTLT